MPQHPHKWDALYDLAAGQDGYITTAQAGVVGYSRPLLDHHLRHGRLRRVMHGVYRLVHFPMSDHEDLVVVWLWSRCSGVFSHQLALALHELSDVLPQNIHITLPLAWRKRRIKVPGGVVIHYGDVLDDEKTWFGSLPVTRPLRTIRDCAAASISPEIIQQAVEDAVERRLIQPRDVEQWRV